MDYEKSYLDDIPSIGVINRSAQNLQLPIAMLSEVLAVKEFEPIKWSIPMLLPEGLTILAGKPKMGKSWMALNIAMAIASGGKALSTIQVEQGEVMYLALEDNERRLKTRSMKVTGGNIPAGVHFFTEWNRMDNGGLVVLEKYLSANPAIRLCIIDTLAKVRPQRKGNAQQYDQDYSAVGDLQSLAHKRSISILLIHHLKKEGTSDPMDSISGTLGLTGAADGMLVLERERNKADAILHVDGRDIEDAGEYALMWDAAFCLWEIAGIADDFRRDPTRQNIIELMRQHPEGMTARQIADAMRADYDAIRKVTPKMDADGELIQSGGDKHSGIIYNLALHLKTAMPSMPSMPS